MPYYPNLVRSALERVRHPQTGQDIVSMGLVADDIRIDGSKVSFSLLVERPQDPLIPIIKERCLESLRLALGPEAQVEIYVKVKPRAPQGPVRLEGVKHIVAVASGKGGVGKSTVTANLAEALQRWGKKVGVLDADIFGPSMPIMFGCEEARPVTSERSTEGHELIAPVNVQGIKVLSIGFFVDPGQAVVWRGAMASNALRQLLTEADWAPLDFLLIDLPPGTSDIQISLVGLVQLTGAIIVTTPQKVALSDARKALDMLRNPKVNVPVLGVVENMSWFTPLQHPEERYEIFGSGGGQKLADEAGVPLLAQVPLVADVAEAADLGVCCSSPLVRQQFDRIAEALCSTKV